MEIFAPLLSVTTLLALVGTALLGTACGAVGTFAVLRQRALVGDALAHAALPGVCVSYLIFRERSLLLLMLGAIVFGLISVWLISFIRNNSRIKEDAAIGIVLSASFGLGISLSRLIQNLPTGNRAGLDHFIFGKVATITYQDVGLIAIVSILSILAVVLLRKELTLLCFDRSFCSSVGFPVNALDMILMALVCACTAVGLPAVGAVLISALLIFPAATARLWTDRLEHMLILSCILGLCACVAGTIISATLPTPAGSQSLGFPTGPLIILSCAVLFVISYIFSPKYGLFFYRSRRGRS